MCCAIEEIWTSGSGTTGRRNFRGNPYFGASRVGSAQPRLRKPAGYLVGELSELTRRENAGQIMLDLKIGIFQADVVELATS